MFCDETLHKYSPWYLPLKCQHEILAKHLCRWLLKVICRQTNAKQIITNSNVNHFSWSFEGIRTFYRPNQALSVTLTKSIWERCISVQTWNIALTFVPDQEGFVCVHLFVWKEVICSFQTHLTSSELVGKWLRYSTNCAAPPTCNLNKYRIICKIFKCQPISTKFWGHAHLCWCYLYGKMHTH